MSTYDDFWKAEFEEHRRMNDVDQTDGYIDEPEGMSEFFHDPDDTYGSIKY